MDDFNEDDFELSEEETEALINLVNDVDDTLIGALEDAILEPDYIADVLMDRIAHIYLMRDEPDFEGLEELLMYTLSRIAERPSWDIQ